MTTHRRLALLTSLLMAVAASTQAGSKLQLTVFESLPPHPSMRDIENVAGSPPSEDISHVGVAVYRYPLADGTVVLVGSSRDHRTIYYIVHEVGGVATKIFPRTR